MSGTGFGVVSKWAVSRIETTNELAVYVALTLHADSETGLCWPSHATLAADSKMAVSSVKKALDSLAEKGLVSWEARMKDGRTRLSNAYTVSFGPPAETRLTPSRETATPQPGDGYLTNLENKPKNNLSSAEPNGALPLDGLSESPGPGFEEAWIAWGRVGSKGEARKQYALALRKPGVGPAFILDAVNRQRPMYDQRRADGYRLGFERWLKNEQWDQSPEAVKPRVAAPKPYIPEASAW